MTACVTRAGTIAYASLGRELASAIVDGRSGASQLRSLLVRRPEAAPAMREAVGFAATRELKRFLAAEPDLVVECAGHAAVRDQAAVILDAGASLMVTSVGAFADDALWRRCQEAAERNECHLVIPSAGDGALDALAAAAWGGMDEVTVVVRKRPDPGKGTPDFAASTLIGA